MTQLVAYLDESRKPVRDRATGRPIGGRTHYVVAAAVVIEEDSEVRDAIVQVEARLGYKLHYSELKSRERRLGVIAALDAIRGWEGYVFETAQPVTSRNHSEHHVRAKTLESAFTDLAAVGGVTRVVLETRSAPQRGFKQLDEKDHQVLQKMLSRGEVPNTFTIAHAGKAEPLLALPDIIAGARSDFVCGVDREPYPLIAHRVRSVTTVFNKTP